MCGIFGYIGRKKDVPEILIKGIERLEYRGYDSAGIAIFNDTEKEIIKAVGPVKDLKAKKDKMNLIDSYMGIAHTRWATHGKVTETNAHPHTSGKVTLVHNGIIENADILKDRLKAKGYRFYSSTDSEVAAALIDSYYEGNSIEAINKALKDIKGSYAFAIHFDGDNKIYAVRKGSPLILAKGDEELLIASDIAATLPYTNKYLLLDDDEIAVLKDDIKVYKDGTLVNKEYQISTLSLEDVSKQNYEHFMLKEIEEEDKLVEKYLNNYIDETNIDLSKYENIHIIGCGSAYYAGLVGSFSLKEKGFYVDNYIASEYRYSNIKYRDKTLVILISQSGETADTIAALNMAKEHNVDTLAIVNVEGSTLYRESKMQILLHAGREEAVATTKAFVMQVLILALLSNQDEAFKEDLKKLPSLMRGLINNKEVYKNVALKIKDNEHIFFIGRQIDFALSLEGSLKLKEISYIHSEAYPAGELKHGTISLIEEKTPVFGLFSDPSIIDKTLSNLVEVKSRGAYTIALSNTDIEGFDEFIKVPEINSSLQGILMLIPLQLIAYYTAYLRGCPIDKPRNLAKSVTVE